MTTISTYQAWFPRLSASSSAQFRLVCFPYAGVGASAYHPWAKIAPPHVEICPIQLPGRESRFREPAYGQMDDLVQDLAAALLPTLDRPFVFFGHSMGALIAFETARRLRRMHAPGPLHLFLSGYRAAHLPDPMPPLRSLSDDDFVRELGKRYNGIPDQILQEPELLQMFLPILRKDLEIIETYRYLPDEPLDCPISIFGGDQDRRVSLPELQAWRQQTRSAFQLQLFTGGHFYLQPHREALLKSILAGLNGQQID
jgi:surfactin synthase thioesterase subunit